MGLLSYLFRKAVVETASDVSKKTVEVVGVATTAVGAGVTSFVGTTRVIAENVWSNVTAYSRTQTLEAMRQKQDIRKIGVHAAELTPEMRQELEQLRKFKLEILEKVTILNDEIEDLESSPVKFVHGKKIQVKRTKVAELEKVHKATSMLELKALASLAVTNEEVIEGKHSRTKELLQKIIIYTPPAKTDLSTAADKETLPPDNPLTSQRVFRQ